MKAIICHIKKSSMFCDHCAKNTSQCLQLKKVGTAWRRELRIKLTVTVLCMCTYASNGAGVDRQKKGFIDNEIQRRIIINDNL